MGATQKSAGQMGSKQAPPPGLNPGKTRTMEEALKDISPPLPGYNTRAVRDPDLRSDVRRCARDYDVLCPADWAVNPLDAESCIPLPTYEG